MNKKNLCIFGGFASICTAQMFDDNPYAKIGLALLGAILLLMSGKYGNNKV
ncbi:hypothetical protein GCM10027423_61010 [Spirosoma arcticum]